MGRNTPIILLSLKSGQQRAKEVTGIVVEPQLSMHDVCSILYYYHKGRLVSLSIVSTMSRRYDYECTVNNKADI